MKVPAWDRYSETLRRVHQRPLDAGRVKRIAVVGLPLLDRAANPIKAALADAFDEHENWEIVLMSNAFLDSFELLAKIPCDGVLARVVSREIARVAQTLPCPLVNISSLLQDPGVQTVRRDDFGIGKLCARHVVEKGFTRFAVFDLSPMPGWCLETALQGFLDYIHENVANPVIHRHAIDLNLREAIMMAELREWLRAMDKPAALFVTDDRLAIAAINACRQEGIRIPHDVAVISSVMTPRLKDVFNPTLTHPTQDARWLIDPACDRLESLMSNRELELRTIVIPCPGLIQGESTDVLAVTDPLVRRTLDFIEAHFTEHIDVPEIVAHLSCSRRAMERRFLEAMHVTPHRYLLEQRIRFAKKRLTGAESDKLETIAGLCGFRDPKTFRQAFLRSTGVTPGKWRKQGQPHLGKPQSPCSGSLTN